MSGNATVISCYVLWFNRKKLFAYMQEYNELMFIDHVKFKEFSGFCRKYELILKQTSNGRNTEHTRTHRGTKARAVGLTRQILRLLNKSWPRPVPLNLVQMCSLTLAKWVGSHIPQSIKKLVHSTYSNNPLLIRHDVCTWMASQRRVQRTHRHYLCRLELDNSHFQIKQVESSSRVPL